MFVIMSPRYITLRTFLTAVSLILMSDGMALISSCTLKAMVPVLLIEMLSPYLVNVVSYMFTISESSSIS